LSKIVGIPLEELQDPSPNRDAIEQLGGRLDWFFDEFLAKDELMRTRDGKRAADLLVKALQKALQRLPGGAPYDLETDAFEVEHRGLIVNVVEERGQERVRQRNGSKRR